MMEPGLVGRAEEQISDHVHLLIGGLGDFHGQGERRGAVTGFVGPGNLWPDIHLRQAARQGA